MGKANIHKAGIYNKATNSRTIIRLFEQWSPVAFFHAAHAPVNNNNTIEPDRTRRIIQTEIIRPALPAHVGDE